MAKMENNEAIEVLERHSQEFACDHGWNYSVLEALQMGIEALKTEQVTWIVGNNNAQVAVKNMPVDKMKKICAIIGDEQTETECKDAVSRKQAIETAIEAADEWEGGFNIEREKIITKALNELPSVNPQKVGRWVQDHDEITWWWKCSECGARPLRSEWNGVEVLSEYCPSCGAKMEGYTE